LKIFVDFLDLSQEKAMKLKSKIKAGQSTASIGD